MRAGIEVFYTLDRPPAGWSGFSGFVTDDMLLAAMPKAGSESVCVCVCVVYVCVCECVFVSVCVCYVCV